MSIEKIEKHTGNRRNKMFATVKNLHIPAGTMLQSGPSETVYVEEHFVVTFAIGKDHVADLIISKSAIESNPSLFADVKDINMESELWQKLNNGIDLLD